MKKEINLGELGKLLAEGPAGLEKIEKQKQAINDLQESLMLMLKRQRPYVVPIASKKNTIKFGFTGDTQVGSMYQRLDAWTRFYEHCQREDVSFVFHAGDVLDGWRVYRGQEFELHPNGRSWPEQKKMFADSAPKIDGITTIFITGNHDASFKKLIGLVVGDELTQVRPDWKFIGQDVGSTVLTTEDGHEFTVQLLHPGGGTAYAVSYHAQKIVESLSGGQKPDLIGIGHYHKAMWMPQYRNVSALLAGTFQSQTPFMIQHSLAAHIGGWIITVTLGDKKKLTARVQAEFVSFYEPEDK